MAARGQFRDDKLPRLVGRQLHVNVEMVHVKGVGVAVLIECPHGDPSPARTRTSDAPPPAPPQPPAPLPLVGRNEVWQQMQLARSAQIGGQGGLFVLSRLGLEDVARLVPGMAERVYAETEGIPFLVAEQLALLGDGRDENRGI